MCLTIVARAPNSVDTGRLNAQVGRHLNEDPIPVVKQGYCAAGTLSPKLCAVGLGSSRGEWLIY